MPIKRLPDSIIARIAAGEVIGSPYNVVKELLENSLDAGATSVTVNISSTLRSLSVKDDGPGIERDDLEMLCLNHYTSKVSCLQDLKKCGAVKALGSFGFRGEALHSISLCSHLKVTTRSVGREGASTEDHMDGLGWLAIYNGQDLMEIKKVAYEGHGTLVDVSDIFYNNCIRSKHFFKSKSELQSCMDLLRSYGCLFPGIEGRIDNRCVVERDDAFKDILRCADNSAMASRIEYIARNFIDGQEAPSEVVMNRANICARKTSKYVIIATNPKVCLKSCKFVLFINGRLVKNMSLRSKILQKYKSVGGHVRCNPFVFVEMFLDYVDVNVHPSKAEVLVGENGVFDDILRDIGDLLINQDFSIHPGVGTKQHSNTEHDWKWSKCMDTRDNGSAISESAHARVTPRAAVDSAYENPGINNNASRNMAKTGISSARSTWTSQAQVLEGHEYKVYSCPTLRTLDEVVIQRDAISRRFSLISLRELCQEMVEVDTRFFRNLSFVGSLGKDTRYDFLNGGGYIFAQHQTNLIKIDREGFLFNTFYQKIIRDFGNFECREVSKPVGIDIDESLWDLAREYFGLHISDGQVIGVPVVYGTVCEDFARICVSKETEKETLRAISQEIAKCYSMYSGLAVDAKLFNRMKVEVIGTKELLDSCTLMTDLRELYKGFDRC